MSMASLNQVARFYNQEFCQKECTCPLFLQQFEQPLCLQIQWMHSASIVQSLYSNKVIKLLLLKKTLLIAFPPLLSFVFFFFWGGGGEKSYFFTSCHFQACYFSKLWKVPRHFVFIKPVWNMPKVNYSGFIALSRYSTPNERMSWHHFLKDEKKAVLTHPTFTHRLCNFFQFLFSFHKCFIQFFFNW